MEYPPENNNPCTRDLNEVSRQGMKHTRIDAPGLIAMEACLTADSLCSVTAYSLSKTKEPKSLSAECSSETGIQADLEHGLDCAGQMPAEQTDSREGAKSSRSSFGAPALRELFYWRLGIPSCEEASITTDSLWFAQAYRHTAPTPWRVPRECAASCRPARRPNLPARNDRSNWQELAEGRTAGSPRPARR